MDLWIVTAVALGALALFLGTGVWISISMLAIGTTLMALFVDAPLGRVMATALWSASSSWTMTALPLFIWMGEILYRTRLAEDLFRGVAPWLDRLPGRLAHVNVVACGIFAAVSGSSVATTATIGRMTYGELIKRGYDERLVIGSLCGAGTLGLLIPPSIMMIVYGIAAEVSIARLFIAGVLPGLLLMGLFSGYIMLWAFLHPGKTPSSSINIPLRQKLIDTGRLLPVILLIVAVIGSIYLGYATATEAAALGVLGAIIVSIGLRNFSWSAFLESIMAATRTSCMVGFILATGAYLSVVMGFTGLPAAIAEWVAGMNLSPYVLIAALSIFFIIGGCFLDGISLLLLTASTILPMARALDIDMLWFGIYIVVITETALLTPPVGLNLFVLQGLSGRDTFFVARAAFPFFVILVVEVVILTIFPEIVTILPQLMLSR